MRNYFVTFEVRTFTKDSQFSEPTTFNFEIQRDSPILNLNDIRDIESQLQKMLNAQSGDETDNSVVLLNWKRFE